ncbi:hypothetical protein FIBSPDRAFT_343018 [Athelia psychrophila]|uniref:Uncharacterized protein n=1 Tax=Athelia psychrophila TaxID=1759441 RepID=A0A167W7J5_9AGAM|nr:hypothetical protein FIBSPDRAFT_343018 [Fibularhizoctonia sp. CBS 109695]
MLGRSLRAKSDIQVLDGGRGCGIRVVSADEGVEEAFKRFVRIIFKASCASANWVIAGAWGKLLRPAVLREGPIWPRTEAYRGPARGRCRGRRGPFMRTRVQQRFQGVVEITPPTITRNLGQLLLAALTKMACALRYQGVGTFNTF